MITPAREELLALAVAMRGAEWACELEAAIAAASVAGWQWPRIFTTSARLLARDGSIPREMTEEARNPFDRHYRPSAPTAEWAAARSALAARRPA